MKLETLRRIWGGLNHFADRYATQAYPLGIVVVLVTVIAVQIVSL